MSGERKKIHPRKPTGTVPKANHRNNNPINQDATNHFVASNNLVNDEVSIPAFL